MMRKPETKAAKVHVRQWVREGSAWTEPLLVLVMFFVLAYSGQHP